MKLKMPTPKEINHARETVRLKSCDTYPDEEKFARIWHGHGWHHADVLFGILVGLQIAEDRKPTPDQQEMESE